VFIIFSFRVSAQESFIYNFNGLSPDSLVVILEGKSKADIFYGIRIWVSETYKNPKDCIIETNETSYIRFTGIHKNYLCNGFWLKSCLYTQYFMEILIEDGMFMVIPHLMFIVVPGSTSKTILGLQIVSIDDGSPYYKKNGEIQNYYKGYPEKIPGLFNWVVNSISERIVSGEPVKARKYKPSNKYY